MSFLESIKSGHLREQIEAGFGRWGHTVFRLRWLVILVMAIFLGALFSQLKHIHFDSSMEGFFHEDDPTLLRYNDFRQRYGREDKIFIAIKTDNVFDLEFLGRLKALHERAEEVVPYLEEVESLVNARQTIGIGDELVVRDFLEEWPENEADLAELKAMALANPMYRNNFISADGKIAVLYITNQAYLSTADEEDIFSGFDEEVTAVGEGEETGLVTLSGIENSEIRASVASLVEEFNAADFEMHPASGPYTTAYFMDTTRKGMLKYTMIAILLIAGMLALIFRRVVIIFLPLTVSILAMLASLSVMAMMGVRMSFSMQIVPSFLLAVGVGNSVHLFTAFFQAFNDGQSKQDSLAHALQHSGLAIFMTGMTTAGGLLSFLSSNMKPIAEFGAVTPVGVLFALFLSLVLLPALIAVFPVSHKRRGGDELGAIRRGLVVCGEIATRYPRRMLAAWAVVLVVSIGFATQIQFSFFIYNQLPPDHKLIEAIGIVDQELAGASPLEVVVDSGAPGGVKNPDFLNRLDTVYDLIEEFDYDGLQFNKVFSIVDINKELHQALNENQPEYYRIPQDKALIAQELLLFENSGSEDLETLVDTRFQEARLSFLMPSVDGMVFVPVMAKFQQELDAIFGDQYDVTVTGLLDLTLSIFNELYFSMAKTYIIAFLVITPLMIVLIGSLRIGLISMIPNLTPIVVTLGVMGAFDIHLTTATLLTGSIAMGLVVDDTIHFMHNFQRYFARTGNVAIAVRQTLETTGRAITFTTIVLSCAFMVFTMHTVTEWQYFGFITGFCILIALLADILLAPALMALLHRDTDKQQTIDSEPVKESSGLYAGA